MQLLIVHDDAEVGEQLAGMVADYTEHAYDAWVRAAETISTPWDEALVQAVVRHREGKSGEAEPPKIAEPETEAAPPKKRGFFTALRRN
jgi:hypothetical protein